MGPLSAVQHAIWLHLAPHLLGKGPDFEGEADGED